MTDASAMTWKEVVRCGELLQREAAGGKLLERELDELRELKLKAKNSLPTGETPIMKELREAGEREDCLEQFKTEARDLVKDLPAKAAPELLRLALELLRGMIANS